MLSGSECGIGGHSNKLFSPLGMHVLGIVSLAERRDIDVRGPASHTGLIGASELCTVERNGVSAGGQTTRDAALVLALVCHTRAEPIAYQSSRLLIPLLANTPSGSYKSSSDKRITCMVVLQYPCTGRPATKSEIVHKPCDAIHKGIHTTPLHVTCANRSYPICPQRPVVVPCNHWALSSRLALLCMG
jgi:hypothetical protein